MIRIEHCIRALMDVDVDVDVDVDRELDVYWQDLSQMK
jgi:hypothetical protein